MKFSVNSVKPDFDPIHLNIKIETLDELEELLVRLNTPRLSIPIEFFPEIRQNREHNFSDVFSELVEIYDSL
jgi:hypothetical protein